MKFNAIWMDKDFHADDFELLRSVGIKINGRGYLLKTPRDTKEQVQEDVKDLVNYWRRHGRPDADIIIVPVSDP